MKKVYIILILVIVTIAHVLIVGYYRHRVGEGAVEEHQPPTNVVIKDRLDKQISDLKLLSVAETVRQLDKLDNYLYPGVFIGAGTLFFLDDDGNIASESLYERDKIELKQILSNRGFRKALQELGELPKDQASKLLKSELVAALSKYLELYKGFFESQSLDFSTGESADGEPVFMGFRYKVFALMLIAGSLELTNTHGIIKDIHRIARSQNVDMNSIEDLDVRRSYSLRALLHNNLVLASGLYGTSSQKSDDALQPFTDRFVDHKLVDFSAPATEFDMMVRHGVQVPTPDKEHINVRYFDQMTFEDLDELRRIFDSQ